MDKHNQEQTCIILSTSFLLLVLVSYQNNNMFVAKLSDIAKPNHNMHLVLSCTRFSQVHGATTIPVTNTKKVRK